jgi:hypothetical protein
MPETKTYICVPTDGTAPFELQAESYEFDTVSGRHLFRTGDELVGNLLNVQVRVKQDEA